MARLREICQKLAELGEVPDLPDQIEELRSETEHKLDAARKEKKNAEEDVTVIEQKMKEIIIPERILEQSTLIDALYREVQSYQSNENLSSRIGREKKANGSSSSIFDEGN